MYSLPLTRRGETRAPDTVSSKKSRFSAQYEQSRTHQNQDPATPRQTDEVSEHDALSREIEGRHDPTLSKQRATMSRSTCYQYICDALQANPDGLKTYEILNWLKTHRPTVNHEQGEETLKQKVSGALSYYAGRANATIWKFKDTKSQGHAYLWKLADSELVEEEISTRQLLQEASNTIAIDEDDSGRNNQLQLATIRANGESTPRQAYQGPGS